MSTLSEAYRNNPVSPLQLHHIIPLDFKSQHAVPDSHTWPYSDDFPSRVPSAAAHLSVPTIDLAGPNAVEFVGEACKTWGMFQVTNHGIDLRLLEEVESETWRLFSLPAQQKMKVLRSPGGVTGYGCARIAPFFPKSMWHEGFTIMGSSVEHARVLWPHDYKRFCDVMEEYQKKVKTLAHRLMLMILKSLDVSEEEQKWAAMVESSESHAFQLNYYPSCPDPNHAIGLAPHTDSLLLTVLHQSATTGLQILRDEVGWVEVSPVAGALTVNVGDLLHIFSNAQFPTVRHRAVVNQTRHRISAAFFYAPPADSIVAPFSKLRFPRYRSLTVKEYIGIKANNLDMALSSIRI
ncbi:iron ascorbate-dependent oxidoreductase [Sarracenia purpurea var. burkii]